MGRFGVFACVGIPFLSLVLTFTLAEPVPIGSNKRFTRAVNSAGLQHGGFPSPPDGLNERMTSSLRSKREAGYVIRKGVKYRPQRRGLNDGIPSLIRSKREAAGVILNDVKHRPWPGINYGNPSLIRSKREGMNNGIDWTSSKLRGPTKQGLNERMTSSLRSKREATGVVRNGVEYKPGLNDGVPSLIRSKREGMNNGIDWTSSKLRVPPVGLDERMPSSLRSKREAAGVVRNGKEYKRGLDYGNPSLIRSKREGMNGVDWTSSKLRVPPVGLNERMTSSLRSKRGASGADPEEKPPRYPRRQDV